LVYTQTPPVPGAAPLWPFVPLLRVLAWAVAEAKPIPASAAHTTISPATLDELVEWVQRILQSFLSDSGAKERSPEKLRGYLRRWLAPSIRALTPPD
jgi:hypothetical protein